MTFFYDNEVFGTIWIDVKDLATDLELVLSIFKMSSIYHAIR